MSLNQCITLLEANREISRIQLETDPLLETTAITGRVCKPTGGDPELNWIYHQNTIISLEKPRPGMISETAVPRWNTPWFSSARCWHEYGLD